MHAWRAAKKIVVLAALIGLPASTGADAISSGQGNARAKAIPDNSQEDHVLLAGIQFDVRGRNKQGHIELADSSDGSILIFVPRGEFIFGDEEEASYRGESIYRRQPRQTGDYLIDKYPVSMARYERFASATGISLPRDVTDTPRAARAQLPVVGISWDQAYAFCKWAKRDLPTEEEWEKAARGKDGRKFPWGYSEPDGSQMPYRGPTIDATSVVLLPGGDTIPEVGKHPAGSSPFGVEDMVGFIREYCKDNYHPAAAPVLAVSPPPPQPERRPQYKVIRGSSWRTPKEFTSVVERGPKAPNEAGLVVSGEPQRFDDCGFRTVVRLSPAEADKLGATFSR